MGVPTEFEAAFPSEHAYGMSLRDYFAGQCICAYMTWSLDQPPHDGDTREVAAARYAKVAYEIADAMLKARQP